MDGPPHLPEGGAGEPPRPTLRFDWQDWLPWLEATEATPAEKQALIEALWSIVVAFVDLGWQVTPDAPDALPAPPPSSPATPAKSCGQVIDLTAVLTAAVLGSTVGDAGADNDDDNDAGGNAGDSPHHCGTGAAIPTEPGQEER